MKNKAGNWVYDLTTSSLTAGSFTGAAGKVANELRVPGTVADVHNFSLLRFSGPRKERQLDISVYDTNGQPLWNKIIGSTGEIKQ